MPLGKNIRRLREARGWGQKKLSDATGVSIGSISAIELRDSRRSEFVAAFARAFGVPVDALVADELAPVWLTMNTPMAVQAPDSPAAQVIELDGNPDYPAVRRVSVKAQAGLTGYAIEDVEDGAPIVFRADWYRQHGYRPSRMIALRVAGESMVPTLWPGDLIVVNQEATEPRDGLAFLVAYYGEVGVKRLSMDAGAWLLTSDNPDQRRYPPKRCDEATIIIGQVVYRQSERI